MVCQVCQWHWSIGMSQEEQTREREQYHGRYPHTHPKVKVMLAAASFAQTHLAEYVRWHHKFAGGCSVDMERAEEDLREAVALFDIPVVDYTPAANERFFIAGICDGKIYYWSYGIPSWRWAASKPDAQSTCDWIDANGVAKNINGLHMKWPSLHGPKVTDVFLISATSGKTIPINAEIEKQS
jgi:hypothetical protein